MAFEYFAGMKQMFVLVILLLAAGLTPALAQADADDQYLMIYSLLQQADNLADNGQSQRALAQYAEVQSELQKFQKVFPAWNPNIVNFRLKYCAGKIADATAAAPARVSVPAPAQVPTASAPVRTAPVTNAGQGVAIPVQTDAEVTDLRNQLQQLQAEVDQLKAQIAQLNSVVERLQSERATPAAAPASAPAADKATPKKVAKKGAAAPAKAMTAATPAPASPAPEESTPTTVLVFHDGHRTEARNYAIVGQTLWIYTQDESQKVPLSDLDVAATKTANSDRGIIFQMPASH